MTQPRERRLIHRLVVVMMLPDMHYHFQCCSIIEILIIIFLSVPEYMDKWSKLCVDGGFGYSLRLVKPRGVPVALTEGALSP